MTTPRNPKVVQRTGTRSVAARLLDGPRLLALCVGVGLLGPVSSAASLRAQVVPIDEASFRLFRNGVVVGEEQMTIHRLGLGSDARVIGQSEIRFDDGSQARPRLEAGTDLRANTYQNEFTGTEDAEVVISRVGRRFVARSRSAAGEAQREFPASEGTVILEPEVVLLYYFLQPWVGSDESRITALDPRASARRPVTVTVVGPEEVRVGRNPVLARHLRLEGPDARYEVWTDDEGRVLRVSVPGTGFLAERLPD